MEIPQIKKVQKSELKFTRDFQKIFEQAEK